MARVFKQQCRECGSEGVVVKTNRIHTDYSKAYCECKNAECGHRWAIEISFSHTIRPPKNSQEFMLFRLIEMLTPELKQKLRERLGN